MVRGLWTAASGMTSQQVNVDTISNNLANVNTAGYKKEAANFKSLLYSNMEKNVMPGEQAEPAPMQVGHGVRLGSITRDFGMGSLQQTDNKTDLALVGNGFFSISTGEETEAYTKDGSFRLSVIEGDSYALVTTDGNPVLSVDGEPILIDSSMKMDDITITPAGVVTHLDREANLITDIAQLKIVQFANVEGLEATGSNMFISTPASGEPLIEGEDDGLMRSEVRSGYLEGSNVNVADEMVKLIVAQRAYEMNSTAIKTVDTMLQQANELKRV